MSVEPIIKDPVTLPSVENLTLGTAVSVLIDGTRYEGFVKHINTADGPPPHKQVGVQLFGGYSLVLTNSNLSEYDVRY